MKSGERGKRVGFSIGTLDGKEGILAHVRARIVLHKIGPVNRDSLAVSITNELMALLGG